MGRVPELRFPEFSREWREVKLGEIATFVKDKIDTKEIDVYSYISTENLLQDYAGIVPSSKPPSVSRVTKFKKGDILISNIRPYLKKIWMATIEGGASNDVIVLRAKEAIKDSFLSTQLMRDRFVGYVMSGAKGVKMPRGDVKQIAVYTLYIPSLPEQQKIADFLTAVDEKIAILTDKITRLEAYKKGMMQKLLSGELRFPGFTDAWREVKLGEVLTEHKLKSTGNEEVYSVSVSQGLVNQIKHLGRSYSAKNTSNYNLVHPYDIVYTKSPTGAFPYGIIKQSKLSSDVIVSPLYGVFTPVTKHIGVILDAYFSYPINTNNYLKPIIQKGAKNTININNRTFLSGRLRVKVPTDTKEQQKIADFLSAIDNKLTLEKERLEALKHYKQGLLQKMFV